MKTVSVVARTVTTLLDIFFILTAIWMLAPHPVFAADGKEIFAKSCASCHGKTGKGDGAAATALNPKLKDLSDKIYNSKLTDQYLTDIISKGGAAVGKSSMMPAFNPQLKEQDIKDVIKHIRSLAK